jgi:chemotaxis response regulator CheB
MLAPVSSNVPPALGRPSQIRVLLADDSGVILRAVSRLLNAHPGVSLVGAARNFEEVVRLADELQPQVIILDLRMAQKVDGDALRLKAQQHGLLMLAITAADVLGEDSVDLAAAIGADRLLDKMDLDERLIPTIMELAGTTRPS